MKNKEHSEITNTHVHAWEQARRLFLHKQHDANINLREKFSPGSEFEPESSALRAGAISTKLPRWSTVPSYNSSLIRSPSPSGKH